MIEETYEARKGVEFLTSTRGEWRGISFEGHLVWHLALYYLGKLVHTIHNMLVPLQGSPYTGRFW